MFYFTINQAHAEHSNREKCQEKGLDVYFAFFFPHIKTGQTAMHMKAYVTVI